MFRAAALTLLLVVATSASAQVIYAPVQYQYTNGVTYYYGGSDASMNHYIEHVKCRNGYPSEISGGYNHLRCTMGQIGEQKYVFTDCLMYRNAAVYGYTATDARNEAYANVATYYTKRDLMNAAVPDAAGTLVVPAHGRPADSMKMHPKAGNTATTQPSEPKPRAIIIIPKGAPKAPKADDTEVKKVMASAN
jgi:hypothetical protein